jgi:hypothetical protein
MCNRLTLCALGFAAALLVSHFSALLVWLGLKHGFHPGNTREKVADVRRASDDTRPFPLKKKHLSAHLYT